MRRLPVKPLRVVFLAAHVKHYRRAFFDCLHRILKEDGIELRVLYGPPNSAHAARKDNVSLPETYGRPVHSYWLADRVIMQWAWREIAEADLIITPNENKLLLNPLLLAMRAGGMKKVAFWGKGNITPAKLSNPGEWFRFVTANAVDWWFPYTDVTAENLRRQGVSCGITPINNAVDTTKLRRYLSAITPEYLRSARHSLGVSSGPIGVFCGNLSRNKHLDFLFAAAKLIHQQIPSFSLIVIGNGPLQEHVEIVAARERFIRYLGPRVGGEKALILKMADVFLLPGAVGLAILDSFAAGLPLLTTELAGHGPEISYLSHGSNGWVTPHEPRAYAEATIRLLQDPNLMLRLRAGAAESGFLHSIENMVESFRRGIHACLAIDTRSEVMSDGRSTTLEDSPGGQS